MCKCSMVLVNYNSKEASSQQLPRGSLSSRPSSLCPPTVNTTTQYHSGPKGRAFSGLSSTPTVVASPRHLSVPLSSYSSLDNNRCLSLVTFITTLWYNATPVREFKFYCVYHSIAQNSKRWNVNEASVWQPEDPESFTVVGFWPPQIQSIVHNFTQGNKE